MENNNLNLESKDVKIEASSDESQEHRGAIKENGDIDWDCPCLNGMAYGPCGSEFRAAFSCFVNSKDENGSKGSECISLFKNMHDCMESNAEHYSKYMDLNDETNDNNHFEIEINKEENQTKNKE